MMIKIKCSNDQDVDVVVYDSGKSICPHLEKNDYSIRSNWLCKISGIPCQYNSGYEDDKPGEWWV